LVLFGCSYSLAGPALAGHDSRYYESIDLEDARHAQTLLAYDLNDKALPVINGAPLRCRVERQLGYKQAKYIRAIELVASFDKIRGGKGGYWEDEGYEWYGGI
jgi:DMSO/TMAO reductase YedYZ molybdopterin-dependent catalytic subunit